MHTLANIVELLLNDHTTSFDSSITNKKGKTTKVKEVMTKAANLVTASPNDTVDACSKFLLISLLL
jgi:CBS domain containing-hemolysin-like protein